MAKLRRVGKWPKDFVNVGHILIVREIMREGLREKGRIGAKMATIAKMAKMAKMAKIAKIAKMA